MVDITSETIGKILDVARPEVVEVNGDHYLVGNDVFRQVEWKETPPDCAKISSLDGLVKLVKNEALQTWPVRLFIEASSPTQANCFLKLSRVTEPRAVIYSANAVDVPGWNPETTLGYEEALIAARTRFQPSQDQTYLLKLLSEITNGAKVTFSDNGVATTVVTQKGIALQGSEAIKPIVTLRPYRTFQELEQPDGLFLLRVSERNIKFVEADGGLWRLEARKRIVAYLEAALSAEIEDGSVVVML